MKPFNRLRDGDTTLFTYLYPRATNVNAAMSSNDRTRCPTTEASIMRKKSTFLGLALVSALAVGGASVAGIANADGWHGQHGGSQMMMLHNINLSDAQRASIKQIMSSSREQGKALRQALRQQRDAFEAMTPNAVGYQAAAASLAKAEGQATQERVLRMANLRAQIYAVLTPAQQSQVAALVAQAQARRRQWQQFKQQHPLPSTQQ
jgi:periplasmic protein CpxP/Spy